MVRIANANELASELDRVLAYCRTANPSREKLARMLHGLADALAMEHSTPEARRKYLKEHPNANPHNHKVKPRDPSVWDIFPSGQRRTKNEIEEERLQRMTPEQRAEEQAIREEACNKPKQLAETQKMYRDRIKDCQWLKDHPYNPK